MALVVFLVALLPRLWAFDWGLPYVFNNDPLKYYTWATVEAAGFSTDTQDFRNPSLFRHLLAIEFSAVNLVSGREVPLSDADRERSILRLRLQRLTVALLGAASAAVMALAASALSKPLIGWLTGLFMSVDFLGVYLSHMAGNDVPALFFMSLAILFCARFAKSRGVSDLAISGLASSLAVATKYSFGVVVVFPCVLLALAAARRLLPPSQAVQLLAVLAASSLAGLIIGMPEVITQPRDVLAGLATQVSFGSRHWPGQSQASPPIFYGTVLLRSFGLLGVAFAAIGLVSSVLHGHRLSRLALLACPAVLLLVLLTQHLQFVRFALPLTPFLAYYAANGVDLLHSQLIESCRANPLFRRAPACSWIATTALTAAIVWAPIKDDLWLFHVLGQTDTRVQMADWIRVNLAPGTRIVAQSTALPIARTGPGDGLKAYEVRVPRIYRIWRTGYFRGLVCAEDRRVVVLSSFDSDLDRVSSRPGQPPTGYELLEREAELLAKFSPGVTSNPIEYDFDDHDMPFWHLHDYARPGSIVTLYRVPSDSPMICSDDEPDD